MSTDERHDLRARLRTDLGLTTPASPATPARPAHTPWYVRALPALGAAAALVFVVGIGLSTLGDGDDADTAAETIAAEEVDTETVDRTSGLTGADSDALELAPPATTFATTQSAESAAAPADDAGVDGAVPRMMTPDNLGALTLSDLQQLESRVDRAADDLFSFFPLDRDELPLAASEPGLLCWDHLLDEFEGALVVDYMGVASVDSVESEVYRLMDSTGTTFIVILDEAGCSITQVLEP